MAHEFLLAVEDLKVHFPISQGIFFKKQIATIYAVDGVSFTIKQGETLGLVGESGCGKSTTARAILQLVRPTSGRVLFENTDLSTLQGEALRQKRRRIQMIFQDPYASLDPRMTVGSIVAEPLVSFREGHRRERMEKVALLLEHVGLSPYHINRYPHEFSGGQRQRIGVARALALRPNLIICDEPVSALDVSIQAQIINLLQSLQEQYNLTYLFIAHDLAVVRHISDRIAVMYLGNIVEIGTCEQICDHPHHPYTQALLASVPIPDPQIEKQRQHVPMQGEVPSACQFFQGCNFEPRCPQRMEQCHHSKPPTVDLGAGHQVCCHLYGS